MTEVIAELWEAFKRVVPESHYIRNRDEEVTYPYLTFTYTGEPVNKNTKGFYLDVDIFDNLGGDDERIEKTLSEFIDFVDDDKNRILSDELFIRFDSIKTNPIDTGSEKLQRRYAQVYCRVDWRKK